MSLLDNSTPIASKWNNREFSTDIYHYRKTLYLHNKSKKLFFFEHGGAAMAVSSEPHWVSREEAIDWIVKFTRDSITGYGYTREQAEIMVDGGDAGRGYRDNS